MKKEILVDGYNVINKWVFLKKAKAKSMAFAREELVGMLKRYSDYTGIDIKVVFDGKPGVNQDHKDPMVIFSKKKGQADQTIERLVYQNQDKKDMLVVTGDSMMQRLVSGMGAYYTDAPDFEKQVKDLLQQAEEELRLRNTKNKLGNVPRIKRKNA